MALDLAVAQVRARSLGNTICATRTPALVSGLGRDIRLVSEWLGHADCTVTLTVYLDLIGGKAAASENPAPEPKSVRNVVAMTNRTG